MNREQKSAAIAEIAEEIRESDAVVAVDYRGIGVAGGGVARETARGRRVLPDRQEHAYSARPMRPAPEELKVHLEGPTALTFVRGDVATAAKALAGFQKEHELLVFKGGLMGGDVIGADEITALSKLPSRQVLYGQLVEDSSRRRSPALHGASTGFRAGWQSRSAVCWRRRLLGRIPAGDPPAAAEPVAAEAAPAAERKPPLREPTAEEADPRPTSPRREHRTAG